MTPWLIHCDEVPPQPWRNGGGVTRELLAWPPGSGDAWQLRVSVADIHDDGPFSTFAGVQRWFAVLSGAGVELTMDGTAHRLTRGDPPLAFDGSARTRCRLLAGPTRDLNLMLRRPGGERTDECSAEDTGGLLSIVPGQDWQTASAPCGLFTAQAGRCVADGMSHEVPALALLCFDQAPERLRFDCDSSPQAGPAGWWWAGHAEQARREQPR